MRFEYRADESSQFRIGQDRTERAMQYLATGVGEPEPGRDILPAFQVNPFEFDGVGDLTSRSDSLKRR